MNNDSIIVKGKIDITINEAFKKILKTLNMTQQDFIDKVVKDFVLKNLHLVMDEGIKNK